MTRPAAVSEPLLNEVPGTDLQVSHGRSEGQGGGLKLGNWWTISVSSWVAHIWIIEFCCGSHI